MATNAFIEIDLPEASDLADYTGIWYDLYSAREFARILLEAFEKQPPDYSLSAPLTIAIIVQYARAFVTGVRRRLDRNALAVFSAEQLTKHDNLYALRDKHIAHSVNTFEENQPIARYWVERVQDEGITSIECQHQRIVGLSKQDLWDIITLTSVMIEYVDARRAEEKAKVLEVVRLMPLEKVLSGTPRVFHPDTAHPLAPRRASRRLAPGRDQSE